MFKNFNLTSKKIDQFMHLLEALLLVIFIPLILRYQIQLLSYLDWGDETGTIVTSKMMAAGQKLFSDIHELHGPLAYLPGVLVEQFGDFGVRGHRIFILILQWLALISIYFSPLKINRLYKTIYCTVCATIMVIYFPEIFGHTMIFQVIAGLFFIIILAQYTLPSILNPGSINRFQVIIGNLLIICLPFLAFTYIPITIALFFASYQKQFGRLAGLSALSSLIINIILLGLFGSLAGFIALHFWINLAVSRKYIEGEVLGSHYIITAALNSISSDLSRFGIFALICASLGMMTKQESRLPWRTLLLGLGVASLLVRSMGFQGLPLLYLTLSLPLVLFHRHTESPKPTFATFAAITPLLCVCLIKLALLVPANIADRQSRVSSPFSELVKSITSKDDRIIAWPFKNDEYILSDRLPATGNFWYLPWQGRFYKNPLWGIKVDSCRDIQQNKPKVIFLERYSFGGVAWNDYVQPCIDEILQENYIKLENKGYYIRKDIYQKNRKIILELTAG